MQVKAFGRASSVLKVKVPAQDRATIASKAPGLNRDCSIGGTQQMVVECQVQPLVGCDIELDTVRLKIGIGGDLSKRNTLQPDAAPVESRGIKPLITR